MNIICTNDTSNSASTFPTSLLTNSYMSGITRVAFPSSISSLPSYLCSLPSHQIDLSYQSFTALTDATFPCLDSFQTVILSHNQLTTVNMASGNFKMLASLDLSSNFLTQLPYSILNPTPTSLRYLDLRNNSITYIDLFIYTLKNITINLDNNPINSSNIINSQNVSLSGITNSTVNITFPTTVTGSTFIIDDTLAVAYGICNIFNSLRTTLLDLRTTFTTVVLKCTCASINLRQLYQQNGYNITNDFSCSNATDALTYYYLNATSCLNATNFQSGLCTNTAAPVCLRTFNSLIRINVYTSFLLSFQTSPILITPPPPTQSSSSGSDSNRTGVIVGAVVGSVGGLALIGGLIALVFILKSRAAAGVKKPVSRATVANQTHADSLRSRVQPRNLRAVRLAPIPTTSNPLPNTPVATVLPASNVSKLPLSNGNYPTSAKGIPIRADPVRYELNYFIKERYKYISIQDTK
jgi:hypothetical protein